MIIASMYPAMLSQETIRLLRGRFTRSTRPVTGNCWAAQPEPALTSSHAANATKRFIKLCSPFLPKALSSALCRARFRLPGKRRSIALCSSEPVWKPDQLRVFLRKFLDFQKLVLIHVGEVLVGVAGGPPDFQIDDPGILAQAKVLLKWG